MKRHITLGMLFILGCATGGVVSQLAVPPVRAGTNPTRWEYNCISTTTGINTDLNKMGAQGWEMASGFAAHYDHEMGDALKADSYGFCFKRALP